MNIHKRTNMNANNQYHSKTTGMLAMGLVWLLLLALPYSLKADATADCNVGTGSSSTECGVNAAAAGNDSTAVGVATSSTGTGATALGVQASTTMDFASALGRRSKAEGNRSTAVGESAESLSDGSTSLGQDAEIDNMSADAVALGHDAKITNAPGAIAIGADVNGDDIGASAGAASATVIGADGSATGLGSTALGQIASATMDFASALGRGSKAEGNRSTAVGEAAASLSNGSTSLGQDAEIDNMSADAVALGHDAKVTNAPGGIAIGADLDGDNIGATATAPGAIAIGADVVADKTNTMTVGVPIEVVRDDGTTQIVVNEKSTGNSVRTLFNVVCDTCTPGFRFNQLLPSNNTWNFRMLQSGNFSVDDPATIGKEAEFRSGGDLRIGGTLIQASSRDLKTDFTNLNLGTILDKVEQLSITEWSYKKDQGKVKHIGPVAEDFYQVFGLGDTETGISSVDTAGVALAAIQALNAEKDSEIASLKAELHELKLMLKQVIRQTRLSEISGNSF